ncbi:MAG: response regulator [Synergistaceae bacterium]|jgi:signal transduction histidine kinase/CheY-like chemotaxis protein/HAMP domain-containing protein|nr:response regulator [Synergistaceae bacterium]
MKSIADKVRFFAETAFNRLGWGMRAKLIIIFVIIKVIPLLLLALIAWRQSWLLGRELGIRTEELTAKANKSLSSMGDIAVNHSVAALNDRATEDIERMTTDTARRIADFLYGRDDDIRAAAALVPDEEHYRAFVEQRRGLLIEEGEWELAPDGKSWVQKAPSPIPDDVKSSNSENDAAFRYRPPDSFEYESRPLYLEMTFIDLDGRELIKVTTSSQMDGGLKNVSDMWNTYVHAETYFPALKKLGPGEIYVSDVIGAYVGSRYIGMYTPENAAASGLEFNPEEEAYAGMENPLGKRFKGIVRWAAPVTRDGAIVGYVTLALDHDHIMEFTSHLMPTEKRYTKIPSAYEGNYAFIWDYKCRSIVHPRHHSIVGYDPDTGEPQIPWLEQSIYDAWRQSGKSYVDFIKDQPVFDGQSREKQPARELTKAGLVGLDGRYLNNAPQCTGWFDLTAEGGSGSFNILWSGLSKLTTAAAIPYYTGQYGQSKRGFAFVTIGAGLDEFHRPALEMERVLDSVTAEANESLIVAASDTQESIKKNLLHTTTQLSLSAAIMIVLVVFIAIWMASVLTRGINNLVNGISRFRSGERHFRFRSRMKDELGALADSFDEMADRLVESVSGPLVITDLNGKTLYVNDHGLKLCKKTLWEAIGSPYSEISVYPENSQYCPLRALLEGREPEVMRLPDGGRYIKGKATYLYDKTGAKTGYIILTDDVTEMALKQEQLIKAKIDLEKAVNDANRANEYKSEFLARMSHEIRTPMNAIIGMTNIVAKKLTEEGNVGGNILSNLRQIEDSSHHLLGLLNDILDFSKIAAGKIELSVETVDIHKLANTVTSIIRARCSEKNITFEMRIDVSDRVFVATDPLRLRQVLINLLGNSVKFTPERGRIVFGITREDFRDGKSLFGFSVSDSGVGISEEVMKNLFNPFEQGGAGVAKQYGGTGLGLAISRSIVRMLGGDISVESRPGEGSTFSFSLWMDVVEAEEEETEAAIDAKGRFKGKRALLVDDVAINRIIAIDLLEFTGLHIDEAEDGEQAVKIFAESPPGAYDIIYMDVQMPRMDGYEASLRIRAMDREDAKTVPIVALTANAFKDDIDRAMRNGMNAHLSKPMDVQKLIKVSQRFIG